MALPPECPCPKHGSSLWSCTALLLEQGLAGYACWLGSYPIPLLEIGHMGSFHVSSGVGWGGVIGLGPISGATGLGVTTVISPEPGTQQRPEQS